MSSAADLIKTQARKLLQKLLDDDNGKPQNSGGKPEKPLPSTPQATTYLPQPPQLPQQPSYDYALAQSFNNLSLSGQPNYNAPYNPNFVGGFHPTFNGSSQGGPSGPFAPVYPAIHAVPSQSTSPYNSGYNSGYASLTMQHALGTPSPQPIPSQAPSPPNPIPTSPPVSPPATPNSKASNSGDTSTPTKKKKKKSSDDTTDGDEQVQCSGITKAGKRCTRMVKLGDTLASEDGDDDNPPERFCHQHSKELLGPSGFYARKNGEWITFEDWIPDHLQQDTQVALRVEMEKARTLSDVPGYIYTFEIRESTPALTIKLKVGRAVNLVKRIDQWGKQCGSKEQVLRGWYPGTVDDSQGGNDGSLMKGRVVAGDKAAWCHRLERLIHLELADLVENAPYLQPGWPRPGPQDKAADNNNSRARKKCDDCGQMHKEIFEFQRIAKGKYKGKEWETVVKPVIERWGKFIDLYL